MEQLTATVGQNADNARRRRNWQKMPRQRRRRAVFRSYHDSHHAGDRHQLAKNWRHYSVIDGIAFQTNILALNAAVERLAPESRGVVLR